MRSPYDSAPTGALGGRRSSSNFFDPYQTFVLHSIGLARLAETVIRRIKGKGDHDALTPVDKILASSVGGALATWNQPIEVIRIEVWSFDRYHFH
jgi:hypothetical protein